MCFWSAAHERSHSEKVPKAPAPGLTRGRRTHIHTPHTHNTHTRTRTHAQGGYVGVRRVVRLLEVGDVAKRIADAAIDANSQLINLRMSILK